MSAHRWSGWPGAWCLDCGLEDVDELDVAGPPSEVHHRYSKLPHTAQPCQGCASGECADYGSDKHNPYAAAEEAVAASRAEAGDGDLLRAAIWEACPLINPRLSEVDWDAVAARLQERLTRIAEAARLVSQWHDSIGSGPIEELNAELGELWALTHPVPAARRAIEGSVR